MTMTALPLMRVAAAAVALTAWLGCSSLTEVDAPDLIEPPELETPQGATALYVGAQTLFASAFNGAAGQQPGQPNAFVVLSGLLADEFGTAGFGGAYDVFDARTLGGGTEVADPVIALSQARVAALSASQALQRVAPTPASRIGHLFALAGYSELFLGELYCSGVSLADVANGQPTYGTPLTTAEVFARAAATFDSALVYAADSARILQMVRLGKMRALLNLARFAEAVALAAQVPTTYRFTTEHSATVQPNGLVTAMTNAVLTVSEREGVNGLNFRLAGDPRVRTAFLRRGIDNITDVWAFSPLPTVAAPTVLATGIEARLVEAEAALQAGDAPAWLNALNALRATAITPAMAPLADPGEPGRVDLHFRERAFWLFGTGRRHSDLRRLVRQYGRNPEQVFPTGAYRLGRVYGAHVVSELPTLTESRNPNYQGCLSLGA